MWYCANSDIPGAKPVGGKFPNLFGLYDMHGNVAEMCQDRWHDGYIGAPTDGSAWETTQETYRVIVGGDWFNALSM